jgi:putative transposase
MRGSSSRSARFTRPRGVYGAPRVHAELRMARGIYVGRKRVERLMKSARISGLVPKKRGRTTIRVPGARVADDLVQRRFRPDNPNVLWVADLTYLRTWEGWLYLVAVQDAYSRRIVGWSMADHMRSDLVVDALNMAIARRRPEAGPICHSVQGSQFVSLPFGQACGKVSIARSMGSKGCAYDNAVAESFFATLKRELVHRRSWPTRRELISEVFEFVEGFYNTTRRHSSLGYLSPAQFETMTKITINNDNG